CVGAERGNLQAEWKSRVRIDPVRDAVGPRGCQEFRKESRTGKRKASNISPYTHYSNLIGREPDTCKRHYGLQFVAGPIVVVAENNGGRSRLAGSKTTF